MHPSSCITNNITVHGSFPPPATPHPSVPLLLYEDSYPQFESPPPYHQPWNSGRSSAEEEPKLSPEEQKQAVNKLRRQLYSPHIYNIIRRLGNKSAASNDDVGGKRCAVCLEDFETKQFVTITPCNHMFHEECIVPWVKSQGKCPVCRFVIVESAPARGSSAAASSRRGRAAIF